MSGDAAIFIRGLAKRFEDHVVFEQVDLEVERGEVHVVLGRSGIGKSVLLKIIIGLMPADGGEVRVNGVQVEYYDRRSLEQVREKVGMLFQGSALFDSLSTGENVGFGLSERQVMPPEEIKQRVQEMLELVGMSGTEHLLPAELSGGMKKRVALARALAPKPQIMLYDEPTTGLDPTTARMVNRLIKDLNEQLQITSVVVTHDIQSAFMIADRVSLLHDGKIVQTGTVEEIRYSSYPLVKKFLSGELL